MSRCPPWAPTQRSGRERAGWHTIISQALGREGEGCKAPIGVGDFARIAGEQNHGLTVTRQLIWERSSTLPSTGFLSWSGSCNQAVGNHDARSTHDIEAQRAPGLYLPGSAPCPARKLQGAGLRQGEVRSPASPIALFDPPFAPSPHLFQSNFSRV